MESTLADTYRDVIGSLGFEAGWRRGADNGDPAWDSRKQATLTHVMKSGLRQFYQAHDWSFLSPRVRFTLPSGTRALLMPFDFGGILEPHIYLIADSGTSGGEIKVTNDVRRRFALNNSAQGRPYYVEIEPRDGTSRQTGQRWQLVFYPEPSAEYTIEFYQQIHGQILTAEVPYALGGPEHSETILASCLAVWENRIDHIPPGPNAPRFIDYRDKLATSIKNDRKKRPQSLGYNADRSDRFECAPHPYRGWNGGVLYYNGSPISYD